MYKILNIFLLIFFIFSFIQQSRYFMLTSRKIVMMLKDFEENEIYSSKEWITFLTVTVHDIFRVTNTISTSLIILIILMILAFLNE